MGYALAWIAVKGAHAQSVLHALHMNPGGTFENIPQSDFVSAKIGDWFIIMGNRPHTIPLLEADLGRVSAGCDLVFCQAEENIMYSAAGRWHHGDRKWLVVHNSELGVNHLEESGSLPAEYFPIRERLEADQEAEQRRQKTAPPDDDMLDADLIYNIPIDLAEAVTTFRHDKAYNGKPSFEVLIHQSPKLKKRSWWKRAFSRKSRV